MKRSIRRLVKIEIEQTISFLFDRTSRDFIICDKCAGDASFMFTPEKIAQAAEIDIREIYRQIEAGKVHYAEREKIFVCLESLFNQEK